MDTTENVSGSELSSEAGERVFLYRELDVDGVATGREVSVCGGKFDPLGYSDLVNHRLRDQVTVSLRFEGAKVISSTISQISVDASASMSFRLNSNRATETIGLVRGGWLPSGLALQPGMVILPDRCTVKEIRSRFQNGAKKARTDDFLDLLVDAEVSINPALVALEGNLRSLPTPEVIEQQLDQAYAEINLALPKARLVPADKSSLAGIVGIGQDTYDSMLRKQSFLMKLAPKIHAPVAVRKVDAVWDEVVATAESCGVPRRSLVLLAALSAIAVPNGLSPAKRLLKLKAGYTEQDAYNALADLRSLEVLMCLFALFPQDSLMFCTGDKDLALFWSGLRASDFSWESGAASFNVTVVDELLPGRVHALVELWRSCPTRTFPTSLLAASIRRR